MIVNRIIIVPYFNASSLESSEFLLEKKKNEIIIDDFCYIFAIQFYELPKIRYEFSNAQWKS